MEVMENPPNGCHIFNPCTTCKIDCVFRLFRLFATC